ncbi:DUF3987 domain-containing protein [Pseudomonas sp. CFBP 8770]|uniref:DUF3987 domain-containing protein n=1 Tax=unclassified Pseudomonas TaxID=196821 RepID=UPI00177C7633|nr:MULTISPECIES: DUF3987 domain-containing protein [unclassified Pseudomonas]MBD8476147.1 DUF3987 domain-containing protein [Pseudomonas sp. CFBP 8773]MBD8648929.1 DUF3987 domain-containing protein [Pseudomonas sp. CFBP 8770]
MNASLMTEIQTPAGPAPKPLLPDITPPTPYPLDALPGKMRGAVEAIVEHAMVPAAIAGQCVVGANTHLAQTRVNAWHPRGNPEGALCSLFMLSLFDSGEGKSSARELAFRTIDEAEKEARFRHRQAFDEIEAMAADLKGKAREEFLAAHPLPPDPKTQYSDATFEPIVGGFIRGKSAASWDTDEGGQMLGGHAFKADTNVATLGGLTTAFSSGKFERTRSRGNLEGSGVAYNRRLSIHLMAQPVAVAAALSDPLLVGQGFLPRFLLAAPVSLAGTCFITVKSLERSAYADLRLQAYWSRCKEIAASPEYIDPETGEVAPPVLVLNAAAKQVWVDFRNEIECERGALGKFAGLKPFAARGAEQALRLSAVLGFFEDVERIDADCMRRACMLARYSLDEWLRYTGAGTVDPELKLAAELMSWLRDPKRAAKWQEFHANDLGKSGPAAVRSAKKRDPVLAVLLKYHHLLSSDGKQFKINPLAEIADSAATQPSRGFVVADDLRKVAEIAQFPREKHPASTALPQTSAKLSQAETQKFQGLPQNPQNPQPPAFADTRSEQLWEREL